MKNKTQLQKQIKTLETTLLNMYQTVYLEDNKKRVALTSKSYMTALDIMSKINKIIEEQDIKEKKTTSKDLTKYYLELFNPNTKKSTALKSISKSKLPSLVYKHLIEIDVITFGNIDDFQINRFGRKFAPKSGDILYEINDKDSKRYEIIDIKTENAEGRLYIVNQWDKDSIEKFIEYMNDKFSACINITPEE